MSSNAENLSPAVLRQVAKELHALLSEPPEGIKVFMNEGDLTDIQARIEGPVGTPFEGGSFRMKLVLPKDFPQSPPRGFFLTKIFHPNVAKNGEICVNTLKKDWQPNLGLKHILIVVRCLLIHPNPESALNEEAGKLLLEDYADFCQQAKMMTEIHAQAPKSCCNDSYVKPSHTVGSKKRAGDKLDKKKLEKKRALKRL